MNQAIWCNALTIKSTSSSKPLPQKGKLTSTIWLLDGSFCCCRVWWELCFHYPTRSDRGRMKKIHFSPQKAIHQDPTKTRESFKIFTRTREQRGRWGFQLGFHIPFKHPSPQLWVRVWPSRRKFVRKVQVEEKSSVDVTACRKLPLDACK